MRAGRAKSQHTQIVAIRNTDVVCQIVYLDEFGVSEWTISRESRGGYVASAVQIVHGRV